MSKEAMKLALEALEYIHEGANNQGPHTGISWRCVSNKAESAITALREALAKPDFWEGYVPEPNSTCSNALRIQHKPYPRTCKKCGLGPCVELAQQALDKKAENARELGLDYEPSSVSKLAREAGIRDCTCNGTFRCLERLVELVRADERERIKQENAPVIASINAHIQTLEEAAIRARGQA